jgi:hypothetical protein
MSIYKNQAQRMYSRTDLLNFLIKKHNLKSYCELGTQNRSQNFDKIQCDDKFCVDMDSKASADFIGTTDEFFKQLNRNYDLYFIDASHHAEDVKRDFENCLKFMNPNSFCVLHDCNPLKEEHTIVPRPKPTGHWNGDVYKFAINFISPKITVDIDNGCLVYSGSDDWAWFNFDKTTFITDWQYFDQNRKELLNLISWEQFINTN